ncbi:MAG: ribonuclease III [Neisseriaceae bacterium]|jgi:ribonuclease-3|nr:MAG: ribonuclease III [Neisseriaceae bacterium]
MSSLSNLESLLGYRFNSIRLLRQALTHRSYGRTNNERLEFVGDGILDCVIALNLFDYYADLPEGQLSKMRAAIVNQDSLLDIAKTLDLGSYLYLGDGELKSGGKSRPSILADALEAIFAAVMLDSSFTNARYVIERLFSHKIRSQESSSITDYKTQLQEYLQSKRLPLPSYQIVSSSGPEHDMLFTIECSIEKPEYKSWGEGRGKKQASQNAAQNLLELLKEHDFND